MKATTDQEIIFVTYSFFPRFERMEETTLVCFRSFDSSAPTLMTDQLLFLY